MGMKRLQMNLRPIITSSVKCNYYSCFARLLLLNFYQMIRPFHLRDLALVYRLSERSIALDVETAVTSDTHPLRGALVSFLVGRHKRTYVWQAQDGDARAFVQLHILRDNHPSAQVVCLGTEAANETGLIDEAIWLPLFDQLVAEIGRQGIHSLVAEVSETGAEMPILRRAGFAVYTRQDIWRINHIENKYNSGILDVRRAVDDWDIQLLYANVVPRLIQLVEPLPPLSDEQSWLLRENGELVAFVHLHEGPSASWMRLFLHPNLSKPVQEVVGAALEKSQVSEEHPVYCCIRRYQSYLQTTLNDMGFDHWGSQAVMVKQTVHPLPQDRLAKRALGLDQQTAPNSARLVQQDAFSGKSHKYDTN